MNHSATSERLDPLICEDAIRAQMELILSSPVFKNSKRHTRFLRYVVDKTLSGQCEDIKERRIGIEVFDRAANYDLANDAIVRVAAAEIRKRLAQYYVNEAHACELRIELPSGCYVPVFIPNVRAEAIAAAIPSESSALPEPSLPIPRVAIESTSQDSPQPIVKKGTGSRLALWGGALALLVLVGAVLIHQNLPERPLEEFWKPIFASDQVVLCVGDLNWIMQDNSDISTEPVNQLMSRRNHVGPYDVGALGRLAGYLGEHGKRATVYLADGANLTDLRAQPAVFIGAFDNRWTQRILSGLRFKLQLDSIHNTQTVVDSLSPKHPSWSIALGQPLSEISRDYAIVARISSPLTGQVNVIVAGLGPYGTTAATEFVSNPEYFREFASHAPRGWEHKDVEIVLSTDVVEGRSAPPRIVAFDVR